ncbi:hypothetical protein N326_09111, partial [Eurypyga helias]
QDSLTHTKRGQMTWSISLSASIAQRDCLVSQRHSKCVLNSFLFYSFLPLEVEISTKQVCFCTLRSSSLYRIYKAVLKRKLIEKASGIERGYNAEHRFLTSDIKNFEVCKNIAAKKMSNKLLLFLGCLLHVLVPEEIVCIFYQCRQKYSETEKTRHAVTGYKVRDQREHRIIVATRKQTRTIHYLLRAHARECRVPVKPQHLKGESEDTKSSRGPDPE